VSMVFLDLTALDKDVGRAHAAVLRSSAALRVEPEGSHVEPLSPFRHVAGKNAYETMRAHPAGLADAPLREGLLQWIYALTHARVAFETDVAWAREACALRGHVLLETPRETSYREAWRSAVLARDAATRGAWLEAAAELAPKLAPIAREATARREEVQRRFGFERSHEPTGELPEARLREGAQALLAKTAELRSWLRRESPEPRDVPTPHDALAQWIEEGLARDAADGWPARLSQRWLAETLPELSRGVHERPRLPAVAGAASFARALYAFGRAMREGGKNALPFAVAKAPLWADPHRFGFVVGGLAAQRVFHRTLLGLGARAANRQARSLAKTALLEAAWVAARWLLTRGGARRYEWEEVTHDVFGGPVDARFAGAWPERRGNEGPRLEALLTAQPLSTSLVSRFDSDWFKNPRAGEWVRARAGGPARLPAEGEEDPTSLASSLARFFEEALG
jgi:hypothetical protein